MVKIGVLTDMSSLYSDINGPGAVVATQMAIDEMGGTVLGKPIELVQADVQNKPDVAVSTAGRWYDVDKVDVILGTGASSSSIATMGVAGQKHKIYLATDPASSDITGKLCNPYTVHWVYDTAALANGTGSAVVKSGGDTWFFLTADYAFGYALERDVTAGRQGEWRQGHRRREPPAQHLRFLVLPAAGAGLRKPRSSASPMPAATRSTRSSRPPSSASSRAARSSPGCWSSSPTCTASGCRWRRA